MPRPKKPEEKAKEPENTQISRDDFVRTRDSYSLSREERDHALEGVGLLALPINTIRQTTYNILYAIGCGAWDPEHAALTATPQVVTGLTSLQAAVQDLARAYIEHTNTVLGSKGEAMPFAQLNLAAKPPGAENGFFSARGPTPAPAPEAPVEGKKRKRAPHDKNAPKRALTPFFLYLQSERATIGSQLGENHTAKEVQDEGGRRWRDMPEPEKAKWTDEYGANFARYQEHMKAYKAGQPLPEISHAEAKKLYEKNKLEKASKASKPTAPAPVANAAPVETVDDSDDSSSDDDSPDPPKEPTPPPAKKQKITKESAKKKAAAAAKVDEPALDPQLRAAASPEKEKKKKKVSKKEKDAAAAAAVSSTPKAAEAEPKPKKKGRKSKGGDVEA